MAGARSPGQHGIGWFSGSELRRGVVDRARGWPRVLGVVGGVLVGGVTLAATASENPRAGGGEPPTAPGSVSNASEMARRSVAAARDAGPPSPEDTLRAWRVLRGWLDNWSPPATWGPDAAGVPEVHGAFVTLRLDGEVVGRGAAVVSEAPAARSDRDDEARRVIWRAFVEAMTNAERVLPLPNDATRWERARKLGPLLDMSLELAGPLTPIEPESYEAVDRLVSPGAEGLAIRRIGNAAPGTAGAAAGTSPASLQAMSPGSMMSAALTPSDAARALVARVTGEPAAGLGELAKLRAERGLRVLRFPVTHLVQPARLPAGAGATATGSPSAGNQSTSGPVFAFRGTRPVELGKVNRGALLEAADRLVRHVAARSVDTGGRVMLRPLIESSTRVPVEAAPDLKPTDFASPAQTALAVFALRRYAALGPRAATAGLATATADALMDALDANEAAAAMELGGGGTPALVVLAITERNGPGTIREVETRLLRKAAAAVRAGFDPKAGFAGEVRPAEQAALAAALARLESVPGESANLGRAAIQRLFQQTPPAQLDSTMPMLLWAEIWVSESAAGGAGGGGVGGAPPDGEAGAKGGQPAALPSVAALRAARSDLLARQLAARAASGLSTNPDFEGGFAGPEGAPPTWDSLRGLTTLAVMLGRRDLTPDAPAEAISLVRASRFALQLQMTESSLWLAGPGAAGRSVGGMRSAPWRTDLPADASSMGLIALTEAVRALDDRAK